MTETRSAWRTRQRALRVRRRVTAVLTVLLILAAAAFAASFAGDCGGAADAAGGGVTQRVYEEAYQAGARADPERRSLTMPVAGTVTSGFGWRDDPITGETSFHPAIDIAAPEGTPVAAALDGIVVESGWDEVYGWRVAVWHSTRLTTYYGHCSSIAVEVGQAVATGETIAYVGSTGRSTGAHLDFQVVADGETVDPVELLP